MPREGIELAADLIRADKDVFENCNTSGGSFEGFFMEDLTGLFVAFGAQCEDKKWLFDIAIELCKTDDYGVRRRVAERAAEYLLAPLAPQRRVLSLRQCSAPRPACTWSESIPRCL